MVWPFKRGTRAAKDRIDLSGTRPVFSAPLTPDEPTAFVGDIHGCDHLLDRILDRLAEVAPDARLVTVGDYVDRGEASRAVLARLMALSESDPRFVALAGNHEAMMLDFLERPEEAGPRWMRHGGLQSCASFGLRGLRQNATPSDFRIAADELLDALGPMAVWLKGLPLTHRTGNVTAVHAAASPHRPLDAQKRATLLWGHPEFADVDRDDGQWIVHGHTIVPLIEAHRGRIGVDTGAYLTGQLSAAVVRPDGTMTAVSVSAGA